MEALMIINMTITWWAWGRSEVTTSYDKFVIAFSSCYVCLHRFQLDDVAPVIIATVVHRQMANGGGTPVMGSDMLLAMIWLITRCILISLWWSSSHRRERRGTRLRKLKCDITRVQWSQHHLSWLISTIFLLNRHLIAGRPDSAMSPEPTKAPIRRSLASHCDDMPPLDAPMHLLVLEIISIVTSSLPISVLPRRHVIAW